MGSDGRAGAICANGSVETLAGCWAEWRARVQRRAGSAPYAICSAEMRRWSGADKHKENNNQGGVWWEASYQTAGVGGGGRGRCSVVQGGWCWRLLEVRGARSVGLLLAAGERARESVREAQRLGGFDRLRGSQSGRYTEQRASRGEGEALVGTINQYTNLRRAPSVTTWSVIRDSRCMYSIHGSGAAATGRSNDSGSENG